MTVSIKAISIKTRGSAEKVITVKYKNGKTGKVETCKLNELICSNKIKQFLRSEGWVTLGVDPVRENEEGCNVAERPQIRKKSRQKL